MELRQALLERRSVRRYRSDPISTRDLEEILEAALAAPSGTNLQNWYYVVIQSPDVLDELKQIMVQVAEGVRPELEARFARHPEQVGRTNQFLTTLGGAPVCVLAFLLRPDYPQRIVAFQSVAASLENLALAAWGKGIGSCWMTAPLVAGCGPALQGRFAPDKGEFVAAMTLGYPDSVPKMPPRRDGRYTIL